ncbi:Outer membrane protein (porin) [Andreprevotia lacus DSM 23236]|jgi:predicted porin|uniref:Outer membrane protein (Porin) n=1 Tax=Andreprevotia lacus DSM 23236 TaxID=1121001 RepID=A0A1W1XYN0_9NEIS|nr:porin [Andreprevotia lacus]SMC29026.1 Outer membrane protein (porin) [Andreprevotia lacus DSM 23236]
MFKRVLVAAAVAGAFAAPAFAEVKISGAAELDVIFRTHNGDGEGGRNRFGFEDDLTINFDGEDKWDNGLKTIWRVSQKPGGGAYGPGVKGWGSREAYIGIAGDSWSVKTGRIFTDQYLRHDWPYLTDGSGNLGEDFGIVGDKVWWTNAVQFNGNFGPVNVVATFDAGDNAIASGNNGQGYEIGGGVDFGAGGHFDISFLGLKGQKTAASSKVDIVGGVPGIVTTPAVVGDGTNTSFFTGIRYPFGPVTVFFDYTRNHWGQNSADKTTNVFHGKVNYAFNDKLSLHTGLTYVKDNDDAKATQFNVALHYGVSKNTEAYARVRHIQFSKDNGAGGYVKPTGMSWQGLGVDTASQKSGQEFLIGTWTGF